MTAQALEQRELAVVTGSEVHVQLETATKIFCSCSTRPVEDEESNTRVHLACLGLPGAPPALNGVAVGLAVKVGEALNVDTAEDTCFHRKNYYYPDLPEDFQITQYDAPICADGTLEVSVKDTRHDIGIMRAHLEEDPGSFQHKGGSTDTADCALVNYNRAGTPLVEIVTEPDFRNPQETRAFLAKLEEVLEYLGAFDAIRDGSLCIDANISLVPADEVDDDGAISNDALEAANRTEVENISSHKGAGKVLVYEVTRQKNTIQRSRAIKQETRHWGESRGITVSMRSKEEGKGYRYFRGADPPPLQVAHRKEKIPIPELPDTRRERFRTEYGIDEESALKLTSTKEVANFFESVAAEFNADLATMWVADNLLGEFNHRDMHITDVSDRLDESTRFVEFVATDEVTTKNAEEIVLREMLDEGKDPDIIVSEAGLGKADDDEIGGFAQEAIDEDSDAVEGYHNGEGGALNFLVRQIMQKSRGSVDPGIVSRLLHERLDE